MTDAVNVPGTTWHFANTGAWLKILPGLLPTNRPAHWLEIGSYSGQGAAWVLENILRPEDRMTCIDGWWKPEIEQAWDATMAPHAARVEKVKSRSFAWLAAQANSDRHYDVIYVDGDHDAPGVLSDAVLAWPLLRNGGVMIFDDYRWNHPNDQVGVIDPGLGIDGFLQAYAARFVLLHKLNQVIVKKLR